ncbi:hypothetical protein K502DRAFT_363398 [Neoconidiobolus thromboides FSU 785]|nr:hypothetical protein K502DRAFT_363398 [Neoconidiobolus thromboides FSU 785]
MAEQNKIRMSIQQIKVISEYKRELLNIQKNIEFFMELNTDLIKLSNGWLTIKFDNWHLDLVNKAEREGSGIIKQLDLLKEEYLLIYNKDFKIVIDRQINQFHKIQSTYQQLKKIEENNLKLKDEILFLTHSMNSLNTLLTPILKSIEQETSMKQHLFSTLFKKEITYTKALNLLTNNIHLPNIELEAITDFNEIIKLEVKA